MAKAWWAQATEAGYPALTRTTQVEAVKQYASFLFPTPDVLRFLMDLNIPKVAFRAVSEYMTRRGGRIHGRSGLSVPPAQNFLDTCKEMAKPLELRPTVSVADPPTSGRAFQARWKELVAPVQLDDPVATVLPKATGISWPFASWVTYILSRPALVRSINRTFPLTFIVRGDAYPVAGGNWTQLTISLANFERWARFPAGLWVLSMANCDDKAMDTLGTLWKSNWEVLLSPSAFHSF